MKVNLITPSIYTRPMTKLKQHTAIVFTQFKGLETADIARDYFDKLRSGYASAHYVIDAKGDVVQCIPENEVAYAVTTSHYYSISIGYIGENITPEMEKAALKLCISICNKYDIKKILRHYDITGSPYPNKYVCEPQTFAQFKTNIINFRGE